MPWNDGLNGTALAIAQTAASPLRVMAGPGTGKTFAMKRRVMRLLQEENADPRRMLVVTFTRTAAADLVRELHALGVPGCEQVVARTLHAFCFSLLSRRDVFDYLGRVARPIVTFRKSGVLQFEAAPLMEDLDHADTFGPKRERTKRIDAFNAAWARLQSDEPGWPNDPVDQQFHNELLEWLRFHEAMLIGELVPETLRYLRNNPAAPDLHAFDHVIVDEYQDLNRAEQELIDLLASDGAHMIVGDKDQSIYTFLKHAHPEGIVEFGETHDGTHDEVLEECRRCCKRVVAVADALILHNYPPGTAPRLVPLETSPEGEVNIVQWPSLDAEVQGLAAFVQHLIENHIAEPGEILILTPRRLIGYAIRDAIVRNGTATHSFYHEEMLESDAAQRAFALLSLLVNSDDRVSLRFWSGLGSPSWRSGEWARLRAHCEQTGESPFAALTRLQEGTLDLHRVGGIVAQFRQLREELLALNPLAGNALIDYLFLDGNVDLQALREAALLVGPDAGARTLLERIRTAITQPEMPEEGDFVRVMSLHKSKGLSSKVVIVAGCLEGLIPTVDPDDPAAVQADKIQEQRRLFYVAMTRAREILVLSSATRLATNVAYAMGAQVRGRGATVGTIACRYLAELGRTAPRPKLGANWAASQYR